MGLTAITQYASMHLNSMGIRALGHRYPSNWIVAIPKIRVTTHRGTGPMVAMSINAEQRQLQGSGNAAHALLSVASRVFSQFVFLPRSFDSLWGSDQATKAVDVGDLP